MNSTSNSQQKSNSVSVAINTCIHASHVVNCSINNNHFHSTPSLSPNLALQWVQEKLVPNSPPEHSSSTGRLCMALTNWKQITSDPWVLEAIQGYKIEFWKRPSQACPPAPLHLSQKDAQLMNTEVLKLLEKRAIVVVDSPHTQGFLSRVFLVPKKDGSQRPVINLRQLNQFVIWEHFKMENIHLVEHLIQEGDWMVKIDLKDAYFAVPIHRDHQQWLRFHWRDQDYQFCCLPFGLSSAPRVFTKITRPIVAWLRQLGVRLIAYIDDFLLLAPSKEEAHVQAQLMTTVLQALGFSINNEKSTLVPCQEIEFLGVIVQSHPPTLRLPQHKLQILKSKAQQLLHKDASHQTITARDLAQFIGTASAAAVAIPPGPLFYRSLQASKHHSQKQEGGLNSPALLTDCDREELKWWIDQANLWNHRSLVAPVNWIKITSDASTWGWGAVCRGVTTGGPWSQDETSYHINYLEMLAAFLALQSFTKDLPHPLTVYLYMDNTSAISYLNRRGGTTSLSLSYLAKETWQWCMSRNISLVANHLPGHLNTVADTESRMIRDRWDWQLNPSIFQRISQKWGPFAVDLFASRLTHQLPAYFSWRPDPQAAATDAFLQVWPSQISYANPPWGLILRVLSEISHQQAEVVIVAPVWKSQSWYPVLLSLLFDFPHLITSPPDQLLSQESLLPPFQPQEVQLAVWPTSGISVKQKSFQNKLQNSSWHHGEISPQKLTTHSFTSGSAGVFNGTEIPFLVL